MNYAIQATKSRSGCSFFACSWKLPAYSGAFLLTIDNFSFFTYNWSFFAYILAFFTYNRSFFCLQWEVGLIRALRDCKQRSLTVSKKAPTVSKIASPNSQSPSSDFSQKAESLSFPGTQTRMQIAYGYRTARLHHHPQQTPQ